MDANFGEYQDPENHKPETQSSATRIKWHAGFREAFELYFEPSRPLLDIQWECPLTAEALKLDALITKRAADSPIPNLIGSFFRTWNVVEYKSPEDSFSVKDFHKLLACAHLFAAQTPKARWEAMTITIIRTGASGALLRYLGDTGCRIEERRDAWGEETGIVVIPSYDGIGIQIIQSEKLPEAGHLPLKYLRRGIDREVLGKLLEASVHPERVARTRAFIQVLLEANPESLKGVLNMGSAIIERAIKESDWFAKIAAETEQKWRKLIEAERQKAERERQKAEQERQKAEQEKVSQALETARKLKARGFAPEEILDLLPNLTLDMIVSVER